MKKILIFTFTSAVLLSGAGFKDSLIEEYQQKASREFGNKIFAKEMKSLKNNRDFKQAKKLETSLRGSGGTKIDLSLYEKIIPELQKSHNSSHSAIPAYISLEISMHVWLMKKKELNKKYLIPMAESLYRKNYCSGYFYYGSLLWGDGQSDKAIDVLKEGRINCKSAHMKTKIKKKLVLINRQFTS